MEAVANIQLRRILACKLLEAVDPGAVHAYVADPRGGGISQSFDPGSEPLAAGNPVQDRPREISLPLQPCLDLRIGEILHVSIGVMHRHAKMGIYGVSDGSEGRLHLRKGWKVNRQCEP